MREFLAATAASIVIAAAVVTVINLGESEGSEETNRGPLVLDAVPTAADTSDLSPVALGMQLATQCAGCHTVDGSDSVGPTWLGLFGREESLDDGSTVLVDADYLRESIVAPNAKIVAGFQGGIMPQTYEGSLSPDEIDALVAYIESLAN